jgi:hypothetical protein
VTCDTQVLSEDNIKMNLKEDNMDWIPLAQGRVYWWALMNTGRMKGEWVRIS